MSESAGRPTAATAHALATQAKSEIETHEAVCALRYTQIAKDISSIQKTMVWVATTIVLSVLGFGGWGVEQWITTSGADQRASRQQVADQASQISFLKTQVTTLTSRIQPGQSVVVTSPARAEVSSPTVGPPAVDATPAP